MKVTTARNAALVRSGAADRLVVAVAPGIQEYYASDVALDTGVRAFGAHFGIDWALHILRDKATREKSAENRLRKKHNGNCDTFQKNGYCYYCARPRRLITVNYYQLEYIETGDMGVAKLSVTAVCTCLEDSCLACVYRVVKVENIPTEPRPAPLVHHAPPPAPRKPRRRRATGAPTDPRANTTRETEQGDPAALGTRYHTADQRGELEARDQEAMESDTSVSSSTTTAVARCESPFDPASLSSDTPETTNLPPTRSRESAFSNVDTLGVRMTGGNVHVNTQNNFTAHTVNRPTFGGTTEDFARHREASQEPLEAERPTLNGPQRPTTHPRTAKLQSAARQLTFDDFVQLLTSSGPVTLNINKTVNYGADPAQAPTPTQQAPTQNTTIATMTTVACDTMTHSQFYI